MKKGDILEGYVSEYSFPNKGIVMIDEDKVIVKNALHGQKVQFAINKKRKGKCEGRLLNLIEVSPLESREAACEHFGPCGGCTYQRFPYEEQLKLKEQMVKKIIDEVCEDYEFLGIIGSPTEWGYRNKMEFSFGDEFKDGPLALGLHKKGSMYDIVNAFGCKIVDNDYSSILACVLNYFKVRNVKFYHKITHEGYLRHLLIRRGTKTGEMTVSIITSSQIPEKNSNSDQSVNMNDLKDQLLTQPLSGKLVGILHITNDSLADVVKSDKTEILFGQDYFFEELLDLKFKISTFSFFQTNTLGAEVLYQTVREFVGETKDKLIFDLYSGTGTIAQILAPVAKKVIGVEIVEEAVQAARENAKLNGLINCEFIVGDVLMVIDEIREKPDLIVLDPPRDGIHPKALDKIIAYGVNKIVYISCKPSSLARDLVVLQEKGYKAVRIVAVDQFPQTNHVESIILMTKCGSDGKK